MDSEAPFMINSNTRNSIVNGETVTSDIALNGLNKNYYHETKASIS